MLKRITTRKMRIHHHMFTWTKFREEAVTLEVKSKPEEEQRRKELIMGQLGLIRAQKISWVRPIDVLRIFHTGQDQVMQTYMQNYNRMWKAWSHITNHNRKLKRKGIMEQVIKTEMRVFVKVHITDCNLRSAPPSLATSSLSLFHIARHKFKKKVAKKCVKNANIQNVIWRPNAI